MWSGDIESTFESLAHQVKAGLNMAMCGIPWWNTDIGGFYGADITSDYFKELIVRWFQFGLFSPVMRPMFFEYPDDEMCYTLDSQYMFGDDIIFAPIVEQGQTVKTVYIPDGEWVLTKDKKVYTKGSYEITANIDEFIALVKAGSDVIKCFE